MKLFFEQWPPDTPVHDLSTPPFSVNRKPILFSILSVTGFLAAAILLHSTMAATPSQPEEVTHLTQKIDEGSQAYRLAEDAEISARTQKETAREATRGYRYTLCVQFGLIRSGKYNISAQPTDCQQYISPLASGDTPAQ